MYIGLNGNKNHFIVIVNIMSIFHRILTIRVCVILYFPLDRPSYNMYFLKNIFILDVNKVTISLAY